MPPPPRIVVVGAEAAGMTAAHQALRGGRARGRDLDVVVLESTEHTSYSAGGLPYWIAGAVDDSRRPGRPLGRPAPPDWRRPAHRRHRDRPGPGPARGALPRPATRDLPAGVRRAGPRHRRAGRDTRLGAGRQPQAGPPGAPGQGSPPRPALASPAPPV